METEQRIPDEIAQRLPRVGRPLPDFHLTDTGGEAVRLGGFRQRQPVLLAFTHGPGCAACAAWLGALADARGVFDEQRAAVLIVVPGSLEVARELRSRLGLPFRVLADAAGQTTADFVPAVGATGERAPVALYAADRYGYCLMRWLAAEATGLPAPEVAVVPIRDAEQEDCGCGLPAWPVEEVQP